jgi:hypothetical protein
MGPLVNQRHPLQRDPGTHLRCILREIPREPAANPGVAHAAVPGRGVFQPRDTVLRGSGAFPIPHRDMGLSA